MSKSNRIIVFVLLLSLCIASFASCSVRKIHQDDNDENTSYEVEDASSNTEANGESTNTSGDTETDETDITEAETETEAVTETVNTSPVTDPPETKEPETEPPQTEPLVTVPPQTEPPQTDPPETEPPKPPAQTSGDCLFIGDSRTVGLQLYSGMNVDYFASVGMSIYSIGNTTAEVGDMGEISFDTLMASRQYKRIFIMLGINEIGYPHASSAAKYSEVLNKIKTSQPDATVFIQANIHVSKERSDRGDSINNPNLDAYNAELKKLADNQRVFFLDANFLFDDGTGNLSAEKTSDGVHFYAKDYIPWAQWLLSKSQELIN